MVVKLLIFFGFKEAYTETRTIAVANRQAPHFLSLGVALNIVKVHNCYDTSKQLHATEPISPLHQCMIDDMSMRRLNTKTQ